MSSRLELPLHLPTSGLPPRNLYLSTSPNVDPGTMGSSAASLNVTIGCSELSSQHFSLVGARLSLKLELALPVISSYYACSCSEYAAQMVEPQRRIQIV